MTFASSENPQQVRSALGAILRRLRDAKERSLQDVARAAAISPGFLSEIERGRKDISTERLLQVCRSLEVPIGEVFLRLAQELGAGEPLWAVALEADPRAQLQRMTETLDRDSLRAVARFSTFLSQDRGSAAPVD